MKKSQLLFLTAAASALVIAEPAIAAGPPGGVPMGPPAGVTMGPPAGVTMGPPAGVTMGPPSGVTQGPPAGVTHGPSTASLNGHAATGKGEAANLIGNMNAAHASEMGLEHASSNSVVGALDDYRKTVAGAREDIATYTDAVEQDQIAVDEAQAALDDLVDSGTATQQQIEQAEADLATAQDQLATDQGLLDGAQAEVTQAETDLASVSNKELGPDEFDKINELLGLN